MIGLDLAAWLLEQIAEDEWQARAATPGPWKFVHGYLGIPRSPAITLKADLDPATITYLTALAPERVLAECDAKRRIVELHTGEHECSVYDHDGEIDHCQYVLGDCSTLRLLALPYADRDGYREEWRP